jgi:hypothetical protein
MKPQPRLVDAHEKGKMTSKYKTYRRPEGKAFAGMFAKFGKLRMSFPRKRESRKEAVQFEISTKNLPL